jgi:hypothetical protein
MADALTTEARAKRLEQWCHDVEVVRVEALELVQLHDKSVTPIAQQQFARLWADLAGRSFDLFWSALTPDLIAATAEASLVAGFPVFGRPETVRPASLAKTGRKQQAQVEEDEDEEEVPAAPVRVIREVEALPVPELVEAQVDEVEEEVPEQLPVVITPEPAPAAEPEPEPPAPPPSDGWLKAQELAELFGVSWGTILRNVREGLFDDHMRRPLPGEGRGKRFDPEACRAAVENRPDKRRRAKPKPPKPLRVTADALAADPALLAEVEALLASVRGEG